MKLLPAAFDLPRSEAAEHEPRLEDSDALSCATRSWIMADPRSLAARTLRDGGGSSDGDGRRLEDGPARRCAGIGSDSWALKPPDRDRPERLPGIIPLAEAVATGCPTASKPSKSTLTVLADRNVDPSVPICRADAARADAGRAETSPRADTRAAACVETCGLPWSPLSRAPSWIERCVELPVADGCGLGGSRELPSPYCRGEAISMAEVVPGRHGSGERPKGEASERGGAPQARALHVPLSTIYTALPCAYLPRDPAGAAKAPITQHN